MADGTGTDTVLAEVAGGIHLAQQGERAAARRLFAGLWNRVGPDADALHRCAIAHSMADVQDDPHLELFWDLRAFAAAHELTDSRLDAAGMVADARCLFPSLHLNLADVYLRLGDRANAAVHLHDGQVAVTELAASGYRDMISHGLERVADRLSVVP